jgi:hypothetical protein
MREKKSATMMINSANKPKIVCGYHHLHRHHHHNSFKLHCCWRPKLILQHYISLFNTLPNEEWEGKNMTQIRSYWEGSLSSFFLSLSLCSSPTRLQLPIPLTIHWIQQIELTADGSCILLFYIMLLTCELLPSSGLFTEVL